MHTEKKKIVLFGLVVSLYWFALYTYVPTLSPYAESLGASHKMVGLIVGSYGFTQMILRLPLGVVSDRLKRRKPFVVVGIFFGLLSALGLWYFSSSVAVLLFRSMAGVAASAWVAFSVLFSSYFKGEDAPKATGILISFTAGGQVVAMLLGGFFAESSGLNAPFLLAVFGAALGLALSLTLEEEDGEGREPMEVRGLLKIARNRNLIIVSGLAVLVQLLTFATIFGFTPVAARRIGASGFQLGLLATLATLPVVFSSAMSGTLFTDKLGERGTIAVGFLVIAFSAFVIPFVKSVPLLYVTQVIGGFGRGMVFPILMGLSIKRVSQEGRATAMGFFQAIYGLGMFIGPTLFGSLSDWAGLSWGFWTAGFVGLLSALLAVYLISSPRPESDKVESK